MIPQSSPGLLQFRPGAVQFGDRRRPESAFTGGGAAIDPPTDSSDSTLQKAHPRKKNGSCSLYYPRASPSCGLAIPNHLRSRAKALRRRR